MLIVSPHSSEEGFDIIEDPGVRRGHGSGRSRPPLPLTGRHIDMDLAAEFRRVREDDSTPSSNSSRGKGPARRRGQPLITFEDDGDYYGDTGEYKGKGPGR